MLSKEQKIKFVEESSKELQKYKTVGIVKLSNVPDRLLQSAKNSMRSNVKFIMGRKTLLSRILESNENTKRLTKYLEGTSAIILSNDEPFELYNSFKAKAIKMEAKPNQVAPDDVEVKSGETSMQPGQAVTDLKAAGIDVQIQKGKVVIAKDKVLVKKGESIKLPVAKALHMLGVKPFTATIVPDVILNGKLLFSKDVLGITQEKTIGELAKAFNAALSISFEVGIVNQYTVSTLIAKAYGNAVALGIGANIYAPGIADKLIAKALAQASALQNTK
ncbi:MAG: 50S ribosomal protein L10 [Candidatus Micrarchaeia archaeon]